METMTAIEHGIFARVLVAVPAADLGSASRAKEELQQRGGICPGARDLAVTTPHLAARNPFLQRTTPP